MNWIVLMAYQFFPFLFGKNLASFAIIIIFFFLKKEKKLLHEIFVTLQNTKLKPPTNSPFHSARVRKKTEHSFFKKLKSLLKEKKQNKHNICHAIKEDIIKQGYNWCLKNYLAIISLHIPQQKRTV